MPIPDDQLSALDLAEDYFLWKNPQDEKWRIMYRPYDIAQGPTFDSDQEAYDWFRANPLPPKPHR